MRSHRVLMVSWAYYPRASIGAQRTAKFAKYLPAFGWDPVILTVHEKYYYPLVDVTLNKEIPKELKIIRTHDVSFTTIGKMVLGWMTSKKNTDVSLRIHTNQLNGFLAKVNKWLNVPDSIGWLPFGFVKGLKSCKNCDVIWASSPPTGALCLAALISKSRRVPLVIDLRDPWVFDKQTLYPTFLHRAVDQTLERAVFTQSTYIILVTDAMYQRYRLLYPEFASKMYIIYNGFDPEDFQGITSSSNISSPRFYRVGYLGSLYEGREVMMSAFIRALAETKSTLASSNFSIRFVYRGVNSPYVNTIVKQFNVADMTDVSGRVPYREALRIMSNLDVLLLLGSPIHETALSGKIFDYIGAGKPLLAITPEGELSQFVRHYRIGVTASGEKTEEIVNALRILFNSYDDFVYRVKQIQPRFTREAAAAELARLLETASCNRQVKGGKDK